MLPALDRLSLHRTGEFYPLSQSEVDRFAAEETPDPITLEDFQTDSGDTWRTFRVRSETPGADDEYRYFYYKAAALWQHYDSPRRVFDPLTRQPIWYEDWMALRDAYAPSRSIRPWVYSLPTRDPGTVKAQPPGQAGGYLGTVPSMPLTPTPVPVTRQNGTPRYANPLNERAQESERAFGAYNRARERFERIFLADDPNSIDALLQAQAQADQAHQAVQAVLDRHAEDGNPGRVAEASTRRVFVTEDAQRRQRQVDEARARWVGEQPVGSSSIESDTQLVQDLQASRAEWLSIMRGPDMSNERLRDQYGVIYALEERVIDVLTLRMDSIPLDDPRREETRTSTLEMLRSINVQRIQRSNVLWALENPTMVNHIAEPTPGLLQTLARLRVEQEQRAAREEEEEEEEEEE